MRASEDRQVDLVSLHQEDTLQPLPEDDVGRTHSKSVPFRADLTGYGTWLHLLLN